MSTMSINSIPLLPYRSRLIGLALVFLGSLSGYLYYFDGKPDFLTIPVFAVITSYFETRFLTLAQTNLLDEIAAVFWIIGLMIFAFSKEKKEKEEYNLVRTKAVFWAIYFSAAVWIIMILTIFGWPVFIASTAVFPLFLIAYLILFKVLLQRIKQQQS